MTVALKDKDSSGTLILTRKVGERIFIGSDVTIQLVDIRGGQAKISITAPKDLAVHREEIYRRILREQPTLAKEDAT